MLPVIIADADNTLWDTNGVFAGAQTTLLSGVERLAGRQAPQGDRLAFVRRFDQAIAALHHAHLRYPPGLLVRALVAGLRGEAPERAARHLVGGRPVAEDIPADAVDSLLAGYFDALARPPVLMPGVVEGLSAAAAVGVRVYVLTEGKADKVRGLLATLGLGEFVAGVTEATKDAQQFARLKRRYAPAPVAVIGDQPDRDIAPAREAGCVGVLVPGPFRAAWHQDADWSAADHVADSFSGAVGWLLGRRCGASTEVSPDRQLR